jgi:hypothetical protein
MNDRVERRAVTRSASPKNGAPSGGEFMIPRKRVKNCGKKENRI